MLSYKTLSSTSVVAGPSSFELGMKIARNLNAELIPAEVRIFSDGESKIRIKKIREKNCVVVQSIYPPVDRQLMQALMMTEKCLEDGVENLRIVVPYLGYARQDKEFLEGEVISIRVVAKLFEAMGTKQLLTVDVHSPLALSYFTIVVKNISSIALLADYAVSKMNLSKPIVVSPDQGGSARAEQLAKTLGTDDAILKKSRDRSSGAVSIDESSEISVARRDVILIDDIINSGESIVKAAEFLKKKGCARIYAMCAHALLIGDAAQKIKASGVEDIIATNSIPNEYAKVDLSSALSTSLRTNIAR